MAVHLPAGLLRDRRTRSVCRGGGLVGVDQAVVVAVEAVELRAGAEELAAGDVAVAVAVHPAEPGGPAAAGSGGGRIHRPAATATPASPSPASSPRPMVSW